MPACTICSHAERGAIETALARGSSYARIAKRYGVSLAAVGRHRRSGHLPPALRDKATALALCGSEVSLADLRRDESENLLGHLVNQRQRLYAMLDKAEEEDLKLALGVHGRLTDNLRLLAQVLDQVGGRTTSITNTLIVAPEYLALRSALLRALTGPGFKAARLAVSQALRQIEAQPNTNTQPGDVVDVEATPVPGEVEANEKPS